MKLVERLRNGYAYYGPYSDAVEADANEAADEIEKLTNKLDMKDLKTESLRQQLAALKSELKTIGNAIDDPRTDLTMTMSEIIVEQKKQLAAALAATKSKDAALQSAISAHGYGSGDLHDALAIQPDEALQAFAEKVREQCAHIIEAQDVDPSFKHRMADAIRSLKELPK